MMSGCVELRVDDRVESTDGFLGWIRYVGQIEGKGEVTWYGVEWDDASRGRHDGTFEGRKYFQCTADGNVGSFVKAKILASRLSLGEALKERYGAITNTENSFVALKQQKLEELTVCSVSGMRVCRMAPGDLALVPNLVDLDLGCNLFSSWMDIVDIVEHAPKLNSLTLSSNRIRTDNLPSPAPQLPGLRTLVLNSVGLNGEEAARLVSCCPALETLVLHKNLASDLSKLANSLPKCIMSIDLSDNRIDSWEKVAALGNLPRLVKLNLTNNQIGSIPMNAADGEIWSSLSELSISSNPISSWNSITAMSSFPKLSSLRASGTLLSESRSDEAIRHGVIGRLGKLHLLGGSEISADERLDSEKRYLGEILEDDATDPMAHWPQRVEELKQKYSAFSSKDLPSVSALSKKKATISEQLVTVELRTEGGRVAKKKLPPGMTVGKIKMLGRKLLNLENIRSVTIVDSSGFRTKLVNDSLTLAELQIEPGSYIDVNSPLD